RFHSVLIESEEQYANTYEYVLNNPVHHGFVRRAEEWRWTSTATARPIDSPRVARHRQADPSAVSRRLPDGGAARRYSPGRQVERRGLLGDVGRGIRTPLLLRPRGAGRTRGPPPVSARRVHGRGAVHASLRELLP